MILDQARDLGRLLSQTPEFKKLLEAEARFQKDPAASRLVDDARRHAEHVQDKQRSGDAPTPDEIRRLQELQTFVGECVPLQDLIAAQNAFTRLLNEINQAIHQSLQGPAGLAPPKV